MKLEAASKQIAENLHSSISTSLEARQQNLDRQLNQKLDSHIKSAEESQKNILKGQTALGEQLTSQQSALGEQMSNQMAALFARLAPPQTTDANGSSPPHKQRRGE